MANNAFINEVKFGVGALARDIASVKHFVANVEQRDVAADRFDNACRIETKDFGSASERALELRTFTSTGLTDTALTRTSRSRPPGTGAGTSRSRSASSRSMLPA
jgi:hypothetical protein